MTIENISSFHSIISHLSFIINHSKFYRRKNDSTKVDIKSVIIITSFFTTSFLLIISEFVSMKHSTNLSSLAAHINPLLFHTSGLFKYTEFIMNATKYENLISRMQKYHQTCQKNSKNNEERQQYIIKMETCMSGMLKFIYIWISFCIIGVIQWCLNPIIYDTYIIRKSMEKNLNSSLERHLPYPGSFPWTLETLRGYTFSYIFQATSGIGVALEIAVYDIFNIILLISALINLEFLGESLTSGWNERRDLSDECNEYIENLRNSMNHHSEILQFIAKIEETNSSTIFLMCANATVGMCLVAFEASTMNVTATADCFMKLSSILEYWFGIVVELFLFCYIPTRIQESASAVAYAFYMSHWEREIYINNISPHNKKKIKFMINQSIVRAQKPLLIKGGQIYTLSLETFKSLVGFSLSNVLVLRQISDKGTQ